MARVWFGLPQNKTERRLFDNALRHATKQKSIRFYIGSCPDYSHDGQKYTHQNIGEDVPLLTKRHLEADRELFTALDKLKISFEVVLMIADVEATDEVFCKRFTGGDEREFLRRCEKSRIQTEEIFDTTEYGRYMKSSSFFREFGQHRFMELQQMYQFILEQRYLRDGSFAHRIRVDTLVRLPMYRLMYPEVFDQAPNKRIEFLDKRTMRTMAQYLTLSRLIGEKTQECFPNIIVHPTRNKGVFNERNRFLLPGDPPQPQPTIPIFEMKKAVY